MPVPDAPWIRISTDILGKLPKCRNTGNQYVIVFIDYFTKYVELIATPHIKAETVARALIERVILLHGSPQYLHSDRGTKYLSKVVAETCKSFNIHKTQTTSFHPACNGQSERMMSNILNSLSKLLEDKHDIWDNFIPYVQYSYSTTPNLDSTGFTQFFLNHGRYPRIPTDTVLQHPPKMIAPSAAEFITQTVNNLNVAYQSAENILKERKEIMKLKSEKSTNNPQFKVGDIVYIYEPVVVLGNSAKLSRPFAGPYFIIEMPSQIHAKLRRVSDGKLIKTKVHINRLKKGLLRSDKPIDLTPPDNINATEPAVLNYDEIDLNSSSDLTLETHAVNNSKPNNNNDVVIPKQNNSEEKQGKVTTSTQLQQNTDNKSVTSQMYTVEKILRKKYFNNSWYYRIKWLTFSNEQNGWVKFDDLSSQLIQYVQNTHSKIPTDKKSQRKK